MKPRSVLRPLFFWAGRRGTHTLPFVIGGGAFALVRELGQVELAAVGCGS